MNHYMNKNFTQFIEPANSEHRWWIVGLTLILWAIFYMVLSSFFHINYVKLTKFR